MFKSGDIVLSRSWEPIISVGGTGKSGAPRNLPLELPDGYLLQLFQCPSRAHPGKHESLLLEQSPDETCWRVRANVFGEHPETDEGASEASLARLANGRIVSATRTGYPDSPMLWAFSDDHGETWSEAVALPWSGVYSNGERLRHSYLIGVCRSDPDRRIPNPTGRNRQLRPHLFCRCHGRIARCRSIEDCVVIGIPEVNRYI